MRVSTSSVAPNSNDPLLLSIFVGDMAPGETLNSSGTTIPLPASMSPGAYYIWVVLDISDSAGQSPADRANDSTKLPFTVTGAPGPDLIPQSFTASPSGNAGSNVSYSVTIQNQGTGPANASTTEFRLSASSVAPGSSDPLLLSLATPAIAAGGTTTLSGTNLPIPANASLGTKYIWVTIDATGSAGQGATNQANDRAKSTFTVTGALLPDLVTQSLSVNPVSGAAGVGVAILYTVVNQGTATANASHAEIRLSTSSVAPSSGDLLLYSFQTDSIPANGFIHYGTTLSIPAGTSPGAKYIWVILDTDNAAGQGAANQANDRTSTPFTVVAPDLFLQSFSVDPSGGAGLKVNFNLTIVNQGTGSAAFSTAEMRLSSSSVAPGSSDPLLLSLSIGDLAPGSTYNSSGTTVPIPANTTPGAYYIWMTLDATGTAGQPDRANDRTKVPFTVTGTPGPDLIPQSFTVSPSGNAGSNVSYSISIHNQGTGRADASTMAFRLSDSSVAPSSSDPVLLSVPTPAIDAGGTTGLSGTNLPIPANASPGTKYMWVILDASGSAGQDAINKANDRAKTTFTVTGASLPDLVTQSLSVNPVSGAAGAGIAILYTIVNQGTATANASHAEIRLSTSSVASNSSDPVLYSFQTDSIPANGFIHYGTTLSIPPDTSLGAKAIWVILDTDNAAGQGAANQANDRTSTPFTVVQAVPTGTLTGTVRDSVTLVAISGASVSFGGSSTTTNNAGVYTLANLTCASSTLTVSKSGYQTTSINYSFATCPGTSTLDVSLPRAPTSDCSLTCSADAPPTGLIGVALPFVGTSSSTSCSDTASYSWTFGDNTSKTGPSVTHVYNSAGIYNWSLLVEQNGGSCTRNGSVAIASATSGLPTIDYFRANRDQIAVGETSDLSWSIHNASIVTFEGLGTVAATSTTTVAPTSTTTYKLIATNSAGSQTATFTVRVDSILNVSIRADRVTGTTPLVVNFTVLPSGGVPPYHYQWSFGGSSALATHTWTTATAEDVTCTVTDAHGTAQKSNVLRIVPSVKTGTVTLGFFDLTTASYSYDAACPYCRIGASADGSTKVKVRAATSSPGQVTFAFVGTAGSGRDGALFSFDGTGTGNGTARITVSTTRDAGENVAAVYYQVPDDFANVGASVPNAQPVRTLAFSAQLAGTDGTSGTGSKDFYLRHAPVVFVHGIWSHGSTWSGFGLTHDPDLLYRNEIVIADWDGVSSIQEGARQVRVYLNLALQQMRMQGIAASSVDVVAHSMGGLIAKQISHDAPGLVHKLITLDTPHFGSALADYLVSMQYDVIVAKFFIDKYNHPIESGAVHDLQVSVGATARRVNTGSLRAHSIIGVASDDEPCIATTENQLPKLVSALCFWTVAGLPYTLTGGCERNLLTRILNNRQNDEIVDVDSQRGGFSNAVSQFSSGGAIGQHGCAAAHMNMTSDKSGDVSRKVKTLLDTNRASSAFEEYSLPPAAVGGGALRTGSEITPALFVPPPRQTASDAIAITAPIDGQVVTPGSVIEVAITAPPIFTSAFVVTPDQVAAASAQPFQARIDIPATAIGQYAIGVRADTAAGESATASMTLNVVPNAVVNSLIVNPIEFFLNVGDSVKPFVRGVFADGVTRDLTRSTTVAFVSSNPSVVSALPDGTLRATGSGTARVTVSSDAATAEILIDVQPVPRRRAASH
jgi:PKD repeat protein